MNEMEDIYRRNENCLKVIIEEETKPESKRRYDIINVAYEDVIYGKIRARTLTEGMGW